MPIVLSRTVERALFPLVVMSQPIVEVAVASWFIIWLGFGLAPKMAVALLIIFFLLFDLQDRS